MLTTIHSSNELSKLMECDEVPLLMVCMTNNETYYEQIEIVRSVSDTFSDSLRICMVAEEFVASVCRKYEVKGTPTFIFFTQGNEADRILGFTDKDTLINRVNRNIKTAEEAR